MSGKSGDSLNGLLRPLGRFDFDVFNERRDCYRSRKAAHEMHVIVPAPRTHCDATNLVHMVANQPKHLISKTIVLQVGMPVFGTENDV